MALIHFTAPALPEIPDNITVPQFFLDDTSTSTVFRHPPRSPQIPSLIEEDTGRRVYYEEVGYFYLTFLVSCVLICLFVLFSLSDWEEN